MLFAPNIEQHWFTKVGNPLSFPNIVAVWKIFVNIKDAKNIKFLAPKSLRAGSWRSRKITSGGFHLTCRLRLVYHGLDSRNSPKKPHFRFRLVNYRKKSPERWNLGIFLGIKTHIDVYLKVNLWG